MQKSLLKFLENKRGVHRQKTIKAMKTSWALDIFPERKKYPMCLS